MIWISIQYLNIQCIIHIHIGTCWKPRFHNAKCGSKACSPRFNCSKGLRTSQPKRFSWKGSRRAYKCCAIEWVQQECPWHSTSRPPHELVWSCSSGLVSSPNTLLARYHWYTKGDDPSLWLSSSVLVGAIVHIARVWPTNSTKLGNTLGIACATISFWEYVKVPPRDHYCNYWKKTGAQPHLQCATKVTHRPVASCHTHSSRQLVRCSLPNPPGTCFLKARFIWSLWSDRNQLQLGGVHRLMKAVDQQVTSMPN